MFNKKEYDKQYYGDHREEKLGYQKQYNENNREKLKGYQKKYYIENKDKIKEYLIKNGGEISKRKKNYRENHSEEIKEYDKQWRLDHPEYHKQYRKDNREKLSVLNRVWCKNNRDKRRITENKYIENNIGKVRIRRNQYRLNKYHTDLKYNLNCKMSRGMNTALRGNKAGRHWEDLVGYNLANLIKRLKKTMPKGYVWQDFLNGDLHIDHKIPIDAFSFTKPEHIDFKRCWALSNLQLLPTKENLIKGNKLTKPFQPALAI